MLPLKTQDAQHEFMASEKKSIRFRASVDSAAVSRPTRKGHVLAIAIDEYANCPPLYNCINDSEAFIQFLLDHFNFKKEDIIRLYNKNATQENIVKAIRDCAGRFSSNDDLVILYSGHGIYDEILDEGYWIPVDAKIGDNSDYISNSDVIKYIKAIKTHHTILIIDSCFSGTLAQYKSVGVQRLEKYPSRWLLTSGRKEVVSDGEPGKHSPFMASVLAFMQMHRQDKVLFSELVQYVKVAVGNNSEQIPIGGPLHGVGDEGGEFIFHADNYPEMADSATPADTAAHITTDESKTAPYSIPARQGLLEWIKLKKIWLISVLLFVIGVYAIIAITSNNTPSASNTHARIQKFIKNGMYGFRKGENIIIAPQYEDAFDFSEHLSAVRKDKLYGYIDTTGKVVIAFTYEDAGPFYSGLAPVKKNGWYGFINKEGKTVIPFIYLEAQSFSEGLACVKKDSMYLYIDSMGVQALRQTYREASSFTHGRAQVELNGNPVTIDRMGNVID